MCKFHRLGRLCACLLLLCMAASVLLPNATATPTGMVGAPQTSSQEPVKSAPVRTSRRTSIIYRFASTGSAIIGCMEDGTTLTVLETSNGFYKIDCYDMTGYIPAGQVSCSSEGEYRISCDPASPFTRTLVSHDSATALQLRSGIRGEAMKYLGTPYRYGGTTPAGFDCSGFTQYVLRLGGYSINRTAATQLQNGVIVAKEDLQCGDLVFFQNTTGSGRFASHVGIYIGNGQIIHSGDYGVAIDSLDSPYYQTHYLCARRVILSELSPNTVIPGTGTTQDINSSYWRENAQAETA